MQENNKPFVKTGVFLGELTDEIPGLSCRKAAFGGPKNYSLEMVDVNGKVSSVVKAKGLSLTGDTIELVNIQTMTEMAKAYYTSIVDHLPPPQAKAIPQSRIFSDMQTQMVTSRDFFKRYQIVSEKRMVVGNETLPYGYVGLPPSALKGRDPT